MFENVNINHQLKEKLIQMINTLFFSEGFQEFNKIFYRYYDTTFGLVVTVHIDPEDDVHVRIFYLFIFWGEKNKNIYINLIPNTARLKIDPHVNLLFFVCFFLHFQFFFPKCCLLVHILILTRTQFSLPFINVFFNAPCRSIKTVNLF